MDFRFRVILFILILLWTIGSIALLVPFLNKIFLPAYPLLQIVYSPVCHQESAKLICVDSLCSFLCARCAGIYFGALVISFITLFKVYIKVLPIKYFLIFSLPLIFDVLMVSSNFYNYSHIIALITGFIFGCTAFYYFYIGISEVSFFKLRD